MRCLGLAELLVAGALLVGCASAPNQPASAGPVMSSSPAPAVSLEGPIGLAPSLDVPIPSASAPPSANTPSTPAHVEIADIVYLGEETKLPADVGDASLGPMTSPPPTDTSHPLPRVIIDVTKVSGKLKQGPIQAAARAGYWGKVVECYRPAAQKDQELGGETTLSVRIAKGSVQKARVVPSSSVGKKAMKDREVSTCLAQHMTGLAMPSSRGVTNVTMTIEVHPGDEPIPPLEADVTRGKGTIDLDRAKTGVSSIMVDLERCYADALGYAPSLRGWLVVRAALAKDGSIDEAYEVTTKFPDVRVARCALHRVRKLALDPPSGGSVRILIPIRFVPPAGRP